MQVYTPDGAHLATVGADMTVWLWDLRTEKPLFTLRLPAERPGGQSPLWDFDLRCIAPKQRPATGAVIGASGGAPTGASSGASTSESPGALIGHSADPPPDRPAQAPAPTPTRTHPDAGHCWIAVPLTMGRLVLYRLPYADPPPDL